ncbi:candidate general secretion pathway protein E (Type II traffic warden ATPase) [Ramlibacter tataouinensis TTB310]|uniref:Candidate general secretion pathway protein E (Type II traffic warden ATPase) n=2 Tax=Ramlibacter tataouinensis TaxID=94132 RepID=F5Y2I6_RAMTT|nr:candidate general secretion pathway protein E (Type II traffic warden ATPase) [Ramlibacter tataouinensis TTB310]
MNEKGQSLVFVTHDPLAFDLQLWFESTIEAIAPRLLERVLVTKQDFEECLRSAEQSVRAMDSLEVETDRGAAEVSAVLSLSLATIEATAHPTVRLVDSTLYDALKLGASDIHFEVQGKTLTIKYRIDGVLQAMKRIDSLEAAHQTVSRIKVLSDLDISERRIPQDGRFRVTLDQREIDFRVSIMPNAAGEDAVLRILDRKHLTGQFQSLTLDSLSLEEEVKRFIRHSSSLPYGLLLVTGPTGSGKTTTLYAALSEINTGLDKIVTIEDPIEYQLAGVLQIPVNEKKGLTFAKGLRSVLRHDPDKIMVGEIRDSETAQIAVQAALTGHQVFTTVHANNVFDVLGRFSNMGVDSYSLVAALTGIMAQRLVRLVCPHCAQEEQASPSLGSELGVTAQTEGIKLKQAVGCEHCRGTGYKGRAVIAETLPVDDEIKDLLVKQSPVSTVKRAARDRGFRSLRDSAVALVLRGGTTLEEINRVTPVQ